MIVKSQCAVCGCDVDYDVPAHELHDAQDHATSGFNYCSDHELSGFHDPLWFFRVEFDQ